MYPQTLSLLLNATLEALYMVIIASLIAVALGLPLGIFYTYPQRKYFGNPLYKHAAIVNMARSIPFIILMIAVPFTRLLVEVLRHLQLSSH